MSQKGNYTKKIAAKNQDYHEKEHRKLHRKAKAKVKNIAKIEKAERNALLADLKHANGDLMHFLATEARFVYKKGYIESIDAYLSFEVETYEFPKELKYEVGKMAQLMEGIKDFHNRLERYQGLKKTIGL